MTAPKAPLPDEQTTRDLNRLFGDELKEIRDISLRLDANIAAQAEKIAELEEKIEVLKVKAKGAYDRSMMLLDAKKYFYEKCAALEADNKRLREALVFYADHDWEDAERFNQDARPKPHDLSLPARDALAQTEQKPAPVSKLASVESALEKSLTMHAPRPRDDDEPTESGLVSRPARVVKSPAPCKTCGGDKWIDSYKDGLMVRVECPTCNGTGREVK